MYFLLNMWIFHCYVSLPEGILRISLSVYGRGVIDSTIINLCLFLLVIFGKYRSHHFGAYPSACFTTHLGSIEVREPLDGFFKRPAAGGM